MTETFSTLMSAVYMVQPTCLHLMEASVLHLCDQGVETRETADIVSRCCDLLLNFIKGIAVQRWLSGCACAVGREWRWQMDGPNSIVEGALGHHIRMINEFKGVPGVMPERLAEGMQVLCIVVSHVYP